MANNKSFRGFDPSDKPRNWAEWQKLRRTVGRSYHSETAQQLRFRDRELLGETEFYGEEPINFEQIKADNERLRQEIAQYRKEGSSIFGLREIGGKE